MVVSTDLVIAKCTEQLKAGCINEVSQASCIQVDCETLLQSIPQY